MYEGGNPIFCWIGIIIFSVQSIPLVALGFKIFCNVARHVVCRSVTSTVCYGVDSDVGDLSGIAATHYLGSLPFEMVWKYNDDYGNPIAGIRHVNITWYGSLISVPPGKK
jgi:hypothetical protein